MTMLIYPLIRNIFATRIVKKYEKPLIVVVSDLHGVTFFFVKQKTAYELLM